MIFWIWRRFLALTQSLLHVDSTYFAQGGMFAALNMGVGLLSGVLLAGVLARFFTKTQLGEYDLIVSLASLYAVFALPGVNQLVVQSAARGNDGSLSEGFRASVRGMIIGIPVLVAASYYYLYTHNLTIGLGLFTLGILSVLRYPLRLYEPFLMGKKKFGTISLYAIASSTIFSLALILTILFTRSVLAAIVVYGVVFVLLDGWFYRQTKRLAKNNQTDPGQISYGVYLTLLSSVPLVSARIDKILLVAFFSAAELGVYYVAAIIPASLQRLFQSLTDVTFPKIAPLSATSHREVILRHTWKLVLFTILTSGCVVLVAPFVIPLLFTSAYKEAVRYAQLEALSFILFPVNLFLANFITAQRRITSQFFISVLPSLVKIVLAAALIPFFGILAVIGANFAGRVVTLAVTLYVLVKKVD